MTHHGKSDVRLLNLEEGPKNLIAPKNVGLGDGGKLKSICLMKRSSSSGVARSV
jgi:hypothetical protein